MRRAIFVTQRLDPRDPVLGATVPKIVALSGRLDDLTVLAGEAAPVALPANVRVRTFGARTKAGRGLRFGAALAAELARGPRAAVVVAHMCPIYAVLGAPLVRPLRVPLVLWYAHWHASATLRLAERVATHVATVERRSFPLDSAKVEALGHGIDVERFSCRDGDRDDGRFRVLVLGRYSPAKGLESVLRGFRLAVDAGLDAQLDAYGPTLSRLEQDHRRELETLVEQLGLGGVASLNPPVAHDEIADTLAGADVLVDNMRAGAPDKVVYEAAAACVPVLASNPVFHELFADLDPPLMFDRDDPGQLADRIAAVARLDPAQRLRRGEALRARVVADHSVGSWADRLLGLV